MSTKETPVEDKGIIKKYEIALLLNPQFDAVAAEAYAKEVAKTIAGLGGKVETEGPVRRLKLAYPIKKQADGYFCYMYFSASPRAAAELNDRLKHEDNILRYLIFIKRRRNVKYQSERRRRPSLPAPDAPREAATPASAVDNEELEKRLEEILQ